MILKKENITNGYFHLPIHMYIKEYEWEKETFIIEISTEDYSENIYKDSVHVIVPPIYIPFPEIANSEFLKAKIDNLNKLKKEKLVEVQKIENEIQKLLCIEHIR